MDHQALLVSLTLTGLLGSSGLVGCGGVASANLGPTGAGLDPQVCVEAALRGHPDPEVVRDALYQFSDGCDRGDAASCSALGVIYERGVSVPADPRRAVELFERACSEGNDPGCTNLARAYVSGVGVSRDEARAEGLLVTPCFAGHAAACGELGSLYAHGRTLERDPRRAWSLLERGCLGGHADSCFDLAELFETAVLPDGGGRARELYGRACASGVEAACARLDARFARSTTPTPCAAGACRAAEPAAVALDLAR